MVQGEPRDGDVIINVEDLTFAVEDYYEFIIEHFEIDYNSSGFKRGFAIYPNGERGGC